MIAKDRIILRDLVKRMLAQYHSERNQSLRNAWTELNDLQATRPLVLVSPENAWTEILKNWVFACEGELARHFERNIRQRLYLCDTVQDDTVFNNYLLVPPVFDNDGFGVEIHHIHSDSEQGAYAFDPPLANLDEDLEKLSFRNIRYDQEASVQRLNAVRDAVGDLIEVHMGGTMDWTNGLTWDTIKLIGLENLMIAMYDNPEGLHRLMSFMRDERMHWLDQMEAGGWLALNSGADLIGSGNCGLNSTLPSYANPPEGQIAFRHLWGLSESQETVGVSPEMFGEFIFPYQKPLIERFGLSYYGCCEPVEDRFEYLKQISNLRCLSISPWSDLEKSAALLGRDYVYCRKPNPSPICTDFDENAMREDIRNTLYAAGDLNLMMILKDTHTVQNEPERFERWVALVREEIDRYSGV